MRSMGDSNLSVDVNTSVNGGAVLVLPCNEGAAIHSAAFALLPLEYTLGDPHNPVLMKHE